MAIVSGDAVPDDSHKLLAMVHFEADLISIPQPTESEVAKTGKLLLGIAVLVIIGGSAALLLGFFLGGGRALYRVAHGKPASTVYDEEFIQSRPAGRMGQNLAVGWQGASEGLMAVETLWKTGLNPRNTVKRRESPRFERRT